MYSPFKGPGPPGTYVAPIPLLTVVALMCCFPVIVSAEKNNIFYVRNICKTYFLQGIYRPTDGGQLVSQNDKNLECTMTFQTHTVLQRFMVRFDRLHLDCNDHLYVYDGGNAVGSYKANLSCRNTTEGFGIMFTGTNFLTLKYITDSWGTEENGFELTMTAFKDQVVQACSDFTCIFKNACISKDLVCDGYNHCMDGSDEAIPRPCHNLEGKNIFSLTRIYMVPIVIISIMVACMCIIIVLIYIRSCRSSRQCVSSSFHNSAANFQLENMHGANGTSIGLVDGTTVLGNSKCTPNTIPGNWRRPAGLKLGYSEVRVRLYCQAK